MQNLQKRRKICLSMILEAGEEYFVPARERSLYNDFTSGRKQERFNPHLKDSLAVLHGQIFQNQELIQY